jgi:hypothetical protein
MGMPVEQPENQWELSDRTRTAAVLMEPINDPAGWRREDLEGNARWIYRVNDREIAEVLMAVAKIEERGLAIKDITKDVFSLPLLGPQLGSIRDELMEGRGFAIIRGLPIKDRSREQIAIAFWGIGTWIGEARSQNGKGHLLGHVKDIGEDYAKARGYMTRQEMHFHTDRADILTLCCLHPAKSGGQHRICSSVTVYNEILKRHPDLAKELTWRFYRERKGEMPPGETEPWVREPIFSVQDGYFAARGPSAPVLKAQTIPGVPKFTPAQKEAIDTFMDMAKELAIDIDLEVGDISFLMNHVILHARTDYEDHPEPERKRHLLRLWLATGLRPLQEDVHKALQGVVVEGTVFQTPLDVT